MDYTKYWRWSIPIANNYVGFKFFHYCFKYVHIWNVANEHVDKWHNVV